MTTIYNVKLLNHSLVTIEILNGKFQNIVKQNGMIETSQSLPLENLQNCENTDIFDAKGALIVPGAVDVHVHSRDPGYTHKEDWQTMAMSAFHGGVVGVCDMPNTSPPVMTRDSVLEKAKVAESGGIPFKLYLGVGAGNIGQIREILSDSSLPLCGLKVYYGQSTGSLMFDDLEALAQALPEKMQGVLVFHSEDQCCIDKNMEAMAALLSQGLDKEGFAIHSKIRSSEAAWASTKIILDWAQRWGKEIHIAHLSTPKEMELIEEAKKQGVKVTSEVAPHHLIFSIDDYGKHGALIKMNPPVRSKSEVEELCQYFAKGKIEYFATDHAPHTLVEKEEAYEKCPSGVPGLDYFWPLLLQLGKQFELSADTILHMAGWESAERFGFKNMGKLLPGYDANFVWILEEKQIIANVDVKSKCGWTPYAGMEIDYKVKHTWLQGKQVY